MNNKFKHILFLSLILLIAAGCDRFNLPEVKHQKPAVELTSTDYVITQDAQIVEATESYFLSKYLWLIKDNAILQIETELNEISSITEVEGKAIDIDAGNGSVWVADSEDNRIVQLDSSSKKLVNTYYIVQGTVSCITANDEDVWVGISIEPEEKYKPSTGGIIKIDQNMNEVVDLIQTDGIPINMQIFGDTLWALEMTRSATLFNTINLNTQEITTIPETYSTPNFIHYFSDFLITADFIWAVPFSSTSNYLFKVDKSSGEIIQKVDLSENQNGTPVDISSINNEIWIILNNGDLFNYDPDQNQIITQMNISQSLSAIYNKGDSLWLLSQNDAKVFEFDPLSKQTINDFSIGNTPQPLATSTPRFSQEENGPVCEGADPPGLEVGEVARVKSDPPLSNRVRIEPYNDTEILGEIEPGDTMTVLEGPVCSSSWVWWKIETEKDGLVGWTAEGDGESVWLERIQ